MNIFYQITKQEAFQVQWSFFRSFQAHESMSFLVVWIFFQSVLVSNEIHWSIQKLLCLCPWDTVMTMYATPMAALRRLTKGIDCP